jgi:hypothetical protein
MVKFTLRLLSIQYDQLVIVLFGLVIVLFGLVYLAVRPSVAKFTLRLLSIQYCHVEGVGGFC